ncbi:hypothetical protein CUT44_10830 [Streptomyces carminius]|uniref:Uncharacterized protein n=1 Tax=Streptomyces carminius TaxID=2665496 RepID=A0A2M8M0A2_9ACTN|nr:hypothetical protein [Streptomyces carminius]PJE97630.1 hypothetical protein CUT44_10830 [Streptomyces carminius]
MSVLVEKVNSGAGRRTEDPVAPVMATPAAFVAGVVAGAKAAGALVAAAGVGAAVGAAVKK